MILKSLSECDRRFDFFSLKVWPLELPAIAYKSHLVCGFDRQDGFVVSIDHSPFEALLISVYKELNVFELARLFKIDPTLDFNFLALRSGFSWCENLKVSFLSLNKLSLKTQHWFEQKGFANRDCQILRSFSDLKPLQSIFEYLQDSSPSKSEAVQILEIAGELILLERSLPSFDQPAAKFLEALKDIRSPMAKNSAEDKNKNLDQWAWPKATSGRFMRRGDQMQLEVKLTINSALELTKRLQQLEGLRAYL